jgi:RimJ/RimL family protein N-acetyltransferase
VTASAVTLRAISAAEIDALIARETPAGSGLSVPPDGVDEAVVLRIVRDLTSRAAARGTRATWAVVAMGEIVGLCSYVREAIDRDVEIGYGVAASRRGRGFATAAVAALIPIARADGFVALVAQTAVANPESARVLEKNGFVVTGSRVDSEDGELVLWRASLVD